MKPRRIRRVPPHALANPPPLAAQLGPALRAAREKAGYERGMLTALAERSQVDRSMLWRYENGKALFPDIFTLWKLADAYHCTLDELVGRVPASFEVSKKLRSNKKKGKS